MDNEPDGTIEPDGSEGNYPAWMSQLPDDLKQDETLSKYEKLGDFAKAYKEISQKAEGTIKLPDENASDEEKAAFFKAIGRPEKPDDYELAEPKLPEGLPVNKDLESEYKNIAHQLGLSKAQAEKMYEWYNKGIAKSIDDIYSQNEAEYQKAVEELKKEWGDSYDGNIELTKRAIEQFGGDELNNFLENAKVGKVALGNHPAMIKFFYNVGKAMAEDKFIAGEKGGEPGTIEATGQLYYPSMHKEE